MGVTNQNPIVMRFNNINPQWINRRSDYKQNIINIINNLMLQEIDCENAQPCKPPNHAAKLF